MGTTKQITMAQQTAVEWLEEIFWGNEGMLTRKHLEQAKQMEKEQIMKAWEDGKGAFSTRQPEQYYNETYGEMG